MCAKIGIFPTLARIACLATAPKDRTPCEKPSCYPPTAAENDTTTAKTSSKSEGANSIKNATRQKGPSGPNRTDVYSRYRTVVAILNRQRISKNFRR